jgi:putative glutamine amidotransferase
VTHVIKPRIGVTTAVGDEGESLRLRRDYVRALEIAGAVPLLLPVVDHLSAKDLLAGLDGLVLSGGGDLHPAEYQQDPSSDLLTVSRDRDRTELALARQALSTDLPLLAICRGAQVLNVAAGGDLLQDIHAEIPSALEHDHRGPRDKIVHRVKLVAGTRLAKIFAPAAELEVNSLHHQAVNKLAPGFRVAGRAEDGIIEAIEQDGPWWVMGVQWHPEVAGRGNGSSDLFADFAAACRLRGHREP